MTACLGPARLKSASRRRRTAPRSAIMKLVNDPRTCQWSHRGLAPYLLLAGLLACGADGGSSTGGAGGSGGTGGSGVTERDPSGTSLMIEVKGADNTPIPNASVFMLGADNETIELDTQTDERGFLVLENLKPGRIVAQV